MNEHHNISAKLGMGMLALVLIGIALISGVYLITQEEPLNIPPRAAEQKEVDAIPHLFFRAIDSNESTSNKIISLAPGKDFSLFIMLSRATTLEQNKKYKFHLKFDYNADVFDLKKPSNNTKLNESERANGDIVSMDRVFDDATLDKVEERESSDDAKEKSNIRVVDIEGSFISRDYASLNDSSFAEESRDRIVIIALKQFQVKPNVSLDNPNLQLFYWNRDDTKIERVDSPGFLNPNEPLKLEMVDKDVKDFPTGPQVIPAEGSDISIPQGGIKTDQTPVIGQTGTGAISLTLSLRFQGILKKPATVTTMLVKVTVVGPSSASPMVQSQTADFSVEDNGVWKNSVPISFNVSPGGGYRILIKGPQHMQKKICSSNPTEPSTAQGSYTCGDGEITLQNGPNTFDFSGITLMIGDLPNQDGVVNAYDVSLIRESILSADPQKIKFADVNYDGVVNTQDYSLIIYALSVQGDQK